MYEDSFGVKDNRTPVQCRNGPIQQRKCTDILCCILYLLLIAVVITFGILSVNAMKITKSQLETEVAKSEYGGPFIALSKSFLQIALALISVTVLCFLMVFSTFIIPALVIYIYIPLFLILMLLIGAAFLYVYFGQTLPLLDVNQQKNFVHKNSLLALGIGIGFLVAFVVSIFMIISKKQKFRNIVPVLAIAKICFWQNFYMIFISFFLSILSVIVLYINVFLLKISQDQRDSQHFIDSRIMALIIILQIIWTHGVMESLSDFIFESIGIHWYFNKKKYGDDYSRCGYNCSPTLSLLSKHFGTIVSGAILAYLPQSINSLLRRFQQGCTTIYSICCCCHKFTLRHLTKYGYSETILQSLSFCEANTQMFQLKRRTKSTIPQLYMMGDLYMTLAKILILMFSLIVVYILLIQKDEAYYFQNIVNLVVPLLLTLMASSEICNHFINSTGLVGDTIVFMYTVDMQIQKKNFGQMQPYSCPQGVREIIVRSGMNQQVYDD